MTDAINALCAEARHLALEGKMNTEEREERLKQIREARRNFYGGMGQVTKDIDFLLSLLDSQVVEAFSGPCVHCGHNNYDAERGECKQRWMEGRYGVVCGCPCARHNSIANAATRMRDACVEKVQARRDKFQAAADASSLPNDLTASRDAAVAAAFTRLLGEIESLTLAQVEKKQ